MLPLFQRVGICAMTIMVLLFLFLYLRERGSLGSIISRPARLNQPRTLLIVAAPGSGTGQMSEALAGIGLQLEHESSHGRDGTVSWFHGMRLLDGKPDTATLCTKPEFGTDWHPMSLEPQHCLDACRTGCWNECWRRTCPVVLERQHGCHRRGQFVHKGSGPCVPTFKTTLLQVRHPLATIASGVRGFCAGGQPNATTTKLLDRIRAVVPTIAPNPRATCAEVLAAFWVSYNAQAVEAADGWFQVEVHPPCEVAAAAGFHVACASNDTRGSAAVPARQHGHQNRHNKDGFAITYSDLAQHYGGGALAAQVKALAKRFGYEGGPTHHWPLHHHHAGGTGVGLGAKAAAAGGGGNSNRGASGGGAA